MVKSQLDNGQNGEWDPFTEPRIYENSVLLEGKKLQNHLQTTTLNFQTKNDQYVREVYSKNLYSEIQKRNEFLS